MNLQIKEDSKTGNITITGFSVGDTVHNITDNYAQLKSMVIDDEKTEGVRWASYNRKTYRVASITNGVSGPLVYREDGKVFEGKELLELVLILDKKS